MAVSSESEMRNELMDEALDAIFDDDDLQEESDHIVDAVLAELNIETQAKLNQVCLVAKDSRSPWFF